MQEKQTKTMRRSRRYFSYPIDPDIHSFQPLARSEDGDHGSYSCAVCDHDNLSTPWFKFCKLLPHVVRPTWIVIFVSLII